MRRPQNSFWTLPQPKNSPLGPQKVKNNPKMKSKSNVRIERNKENVCYSTTCPKIATKGPKKSKIAQK